MKKIEIGQRAPDFSLPGVDGKDYTLNSFKDKKVVVVLFTCNHCPYAQAYEARLVNIQRVVITPYVGSAHMLDIDHSCPSPADPSPASPAEPVHSERP